MIEVIRAHQKISKAEAEAILDAFADGEAAALAGGREDDEGVRFGHLERPEKSPLITGRGQ